MEELVRTPVKKKANGGKHSKEDTEKRLSEIRRGLEEHIGCYAILFEKESREMVPHFVQLIRSGECIVARQKCYSPDGKFRCNLDRVPSPVTILTREQKIVYFDDNI